MYQLNLFGIQVKEEIGVSNEKIKDYKKTNYSFLFYNVFETVFNYN